MNEDIHMLLSSSHSAMHITSMTCVSSVTRVPGLIQKPAGAWAEVNFDSLIYLPPHTHTHTHTHTHARTHSMPLRTEAGGCCRCQYKLRLITVPSHQHTSDRRWMREVSPLRGSHLQLHTGQRVSDPVRLRHHTRAVTRQDAAVMEPSKRVGVPCLLLSKSTRKCHAKPEKKQKAISSGEDWKRGTGPLFSKSSKSIQEMICSRVSHVQLIASSCMWSKIGLKIFLFHFGT